MRQSQASPDCITTRNQTTMCCKQEILQHCWRTVVLCVIVHVRFQQASKRVSIYSSNRVNALVCCYRSEERQASVAEQGYEGMSYIPTLQQGMLADDLGKGACLNRALRRLYPNDGAAISGEEYVKTYFHASSVKACLNWAPRRLYPNVGAPISGGSIGRRLA